jgi:3-oxoacyl-[acyl-carrier protein] reductase
MELNLSGRRAVVCGGSAGIGRACAVELAALGASVVVGARSAEKLVGVVAALPRVAPGLTHEAWVVDLSDSSSASASLAAMVEKTGPVHILINNTGGPPAGRVVDLGVEAFRAGFESLLATPHALSRVVLPGMKVAGYGRIVNITSTSVKQPIANLAVSNAIRAATANWAKTLSQEVAAWGVTVNNVLPGYTDTERLNEIFEMRAKKAGTGVEEARRGVIADIPMGRLGRAEEIAAAVAFLASPAAGYVSGINLPVDGGRMATL